MRSPQQSKSVQRSPQISVSPSHKNYFALIKEYIKNKDEILPILNKNSKVKKPEKTIIEQIYNKYSSHLGDYYKNNKEKITIYGSTKYEQLPVEKLPAEMQFYKETILKRIKENPYILYSKKNFPNETDGSKMILTPMPKTQRKIMKSREKEEFNKAERTAVVMRIVEYTHRRNKSRKNNLKAKNELDININDRDDDAKVLLAMKNAVDIIERNWLRSKYNKLRKNKLQYQKKSNDFDEESKNKLQYQKKSNDFEEGSKNKLQYQKKSNDFDEESKNKLQYQKKSNDFDEESKNKIQYHKMCNDFDKGSKIIKRIFFRRMIKRLQEIKEEDERKKKCNGNRKNSISIEYCDKSIQNEMFFANNLIDNPYNLNFQINKRIKKINKIYALGCYYSKICYKKSDINKCLENVKIVQKNYKEHFEFKQKKKGPKVKVTPRKLKANLKNNGKKIKRKSSKLNLISKICCVEKLTKLQRNMLMFLYRKKAKAHACLDKQDYIKPLNEHSLISKEIQSEKLGNVKGKNWNENKNKVETNITYSIENIPLSKQTPYIKSLNQISFSIKNQYKSKGIKLFTLYAHYYKKKWFSSFKEKTHTIYSYSIRINFKSQLNIIKFALTETTNPKKTENSMKLYSQSLAFKLLYKFLLENPWKQIKDNLIKAKYNKFADLLLFSMKKNFLYRLILIHLIKNDIDINNEDVISIIKYGSEEKRKYQRRLEEILKLNVTANNNYLKSNIPFALYVKKLIGDKNEIENSEIENEDIIYIPSESEGKKLPPSTNEQLININVTGENFYRGEHSDVVIRPNINLRKNYNKIIPVKQILRDNTGYNNF